MTTAVERAFSQALPSNGISANASWPVLDAQNYMSSSKLTDELAKRQAPGAYPAAERDHAAGYGNGWVPPVYFAETRHDVGNDTAVAPVQPQGMISKWRQKEKLKTTAVAMVVCLNIGVDPPDVIKIPPCARLECWVDPLSMQPPKALDTIGKNLQAQYERWQARAKYKMHLDPTVDDVKKLAQSSRRTARNERVLFHYNGHGVPRPTANGEIWVFNKSYTQYIPMSIYDLQSYVGTPAIYLFDCSAAGLVVNSFKVFAEQRWQEARTAAGGAPGVPLDKEGPMRECILLAACGANELLPQSPELPADVFTSCLTTPIKVALRWFCSRSLLRDEGLTPELIDKIPGRQTDRRTPLGELNWIFTAITDTIAWNMLPRPLFQKLFRQDLLVASLFRNYLLAERIMRACNCTPVSWPSLPPTHQHPMWHAWDMAAEICLLKLPALLESSQPEADFKPSPFFAEQLRAFELWLEAGCQRRRPPEQLPIVLQVLLSQVHRARALALLERFLDLGSWTVDLALSVGIFPYVLKLLQTSSPELRNTLVFIWTKILALDPSCQVDLVKDNGAKYFVDHLANDEASQWAPSRAQAAFVLAMIADKHPRGQQLEMDLGVLPLVLQQLPAAAKAAEGPPSSDASAAALQAQWLAHCVAKLVEDSPVLAEQATALGAADKMHPLLSAKNPELRASGVYALGTLLPDPAACRPSSEDPSRGTDPGGALSSSTHSGSSYHGSEWTAGAVPARREIVGWLSAASGDASPLVRGEVGVALARFAAMHRASFQDAVEDMQKETAAMLVGAVDHRPVALTPSHCNLRAHTASPHNSVSGWSSKRTSHDVAVSANKPEESSSLNSQRSPFASTRNSPNAAKSSVPGKAGGSHHGARLVAAALQRLSEGPPQAELRTGPGSAPCDERLQDRVTDDMEDQTDSKGLARRQTVAVSAFAAAASGPLSHEDENNSGSFEEVASMAALVAEVLQVGCLLATDPVASVAAIGTAMLRQIDVEVAVASLSTARGQGNNLSSSSRNSAQLDLNTAASAPLHALPVLGFGSAGNLQRAVSRKLSSWRSSAARPPSGHAHEAAVSGSESSRQDGPITSTVLILRNRKGAPMGDLFKNLQTAHHTERAMSCDPRSFNAAVGKTPARPQWHAWEAVEAATSAAQPLTAAAAGAAASAEGTSPPEPLPSSVVYLLSCQHFSRPLLVPEANSHTAEQSHWHDLPSAAVRTGRMLERDEQIEACKAMRVDNSAAVLASSPSRATGSVPSSPPSNHPEQVLRIETESSSTAACCFHPFKPFLTTVDIRGVVRIVNYSLPPHDAARNALNARAIVNRFHLARGDSPQSAKADLRVSALYHINEVAGGMLLAGATDGIVRVWGNYHERGAQRLSTAWRALPVPVSGGDAFGSAVFDWCPSRDWLAAAGHASPSSAHIWNLLTEKRDHEVHDKNGSGARWQHLAQPRKGPPLLFAAGVDGIVSLFDLRAGSANAAARLNLAHGPAVGMAVGPGHWKHQLLVCDASGELQFLDFRQGHPSSHAGSGSGSGSSSSSTTSIGSDSDEERSVQSSSSGDRMSWQLGTWKTIPPGEGEVVSAISAHPHAPLLATASTQLHQVVRLWGPRGEALLRRRVTGGGPMGARQGNINVIAWHPYRPLLAKAHPDNSMAIWSVALISASGSLSGASTPRQAV